MWASCWRAGSRWPCWPWRPKGCWPFPKTGPAGASNDRPGPAGRPPGRAANEGKGLAPLRRRCPRESTKGGFPEMLMFRRLALLLVAALLASALLAGAVYAQSTGKPTIRIGSKNFTEQLLLGEMYALLLEAHGYRVERKLNLAGTLVAHQALVHDEIDMYPEYTGTGLMNMLDMDPMSSAEAVYNAVKEGYLREWNLVWLDPAPMNNTQAIAVTREVAE